MTTETFEKNCKNCIAYAGSRRALNFGKIQASPKILIPIIQDALQDLYWDEVPKTTDIYIIMNYSVLIESKVTGMSLNAAWKRRVKQSEKVLIKKAQEYATGGDRLHNFKVQAEVIEIPVKRVVIGNMLKHYASIYDIANTDKKYEQAYYDEKFGDLWNYCLLLYSAMRGI